MFLLPSCLSFPLTSWLHLQVSLYSWFVCKELLGACANAFLCEGLQEASFSRPFHRETATWSKCSFLISGCFILGQNTCIFHYICWRSPSWRLYGFFFKNLLLFIWERGRKFSSTGSLFRFMQHNSWGWTTWKPGGCNSIQVSCRWVAGTRVPSPTAPQGAH